MSYMQVTDKSKSGNVCWSIGQHKGAATYSGTRMTGPSWFSPVQPLRVQTINIVQRMSLTFETGDTLTEARLKSAGDAQIQYQAPNITLVPIVDFSGWISLLDRYAWRCSSSEAKGDKSSCAVSIITGLLLWPELSLYMVKVDGGSPCLSAQAKDINSNRKIRRDIWWLSTSTTT